MRVLETAGAPVVYVPRDDMAEGVLLPAAGTTFCEWKGTASYFDVGAGGAAAERAAWAYPAPTPPFAAIAGWVSFYPARSTACSATSASSRSPAASTAAG